MGAMGGAPPLPVPGPVWVRGIHSGGPRVAMKGGGLLARLDYWLDYLARLLVISVILARLLAILARLY